MYQQTFFQQQFYQTGLSNQENTIRVIRTEDSDTETEIQLYSESRKADSRDEADVRIWFPNLYGGMYSYETTRKDSPEEWFSRTRLAVPKKMDDGRYMKYKSPKDSGIFPFFNKKIIEAYQLAINDAEKASQGNIDMLYITEGEKKASRLCSLGLFAVGITGITMWRKQKGVEALHHDIEELMLKCKVKILVFLKDADAVSINYDPKVDLADRPQSFLTNVLKFGEATSYMIDSDRHELKKVVYGHLEKGLIEKAKGVDDLINLNRVDEIEEEKYEALSKIEKDRYIKGRKKYLEHLNDVRQDLSDLSPIGKFFRFFDLNHQVAQKNLVRSYGLADAKNFHTTYGEIIGNRPFIFKRRQYQFDGNEVVFMKHHDVDFYCYVHDQLFKKVVLIDAKGKKSYEYQKIREKFVKECYKNYPKFLEDVPRYESFTILPDNTENFKQNISNTFNMYMPMLHKPQKGKFDMTYKFLKHLFRGKSSIEFDEKGNWTENFILGDTFALMIDWVTILIQYPLEKLPVPCLYSPENGTGKTTFMQLIEEILGENATILGNEEFQQSFNAHYITKLFIGLDEAMVEKDIEKERLKKMVTATKGHLTLKGLDSKKVDFFSKFCFCTNKKNFMKVEMGESRWYVIKVLPYDKREQVPNIFADFLVPEIPQFLYYLRNRQIFHPRISRTWFDEKYYVTEQFLEVVQESKSYVQRTIEEYIFEKFDITGLSTIRLTLDFIHEQLNSRYKLDKKLIKDFLKDYKKLEPSKKTEYVKMPINVEEFDGKPQIIFKTKTGKPYMFEFQDWMTPEQQKNFLAHDPVIDEIQRNSGLHVPLKKVEQESIPFEETILEQIPKQESPALKLIPSIQVEELKDELFTNTVTVNF